MSNEGDAPEKAEDERPLVFHEVAFLEPLYEAYANPDEKFLKKLRSGNFSFDMHCVGCGADSHFKVIRPNEPEKPVSLGVGRFVSPAAMHLAPGIFSVLATCTRLSSHVYLAQFIYSPGKLVKYGQTPAIAEIQGAEIRKYRKQLTGGYFEELNRAVGLISHGIGIGAFVYLRRIFERLIADQHERHCKASGPIEGFATMRMDEKVEALSDVLPSVIVRSKVAYKILSKGIHELSEDECKLYFPVVKSAIINMLEADYRQREAERAEKDVEIELARIAQALQGDTPA